MVPLLEEAHLAAKHKRLVKEHHPFASCQPIRYPQGDVSHYIVWARPASQQRLATGKTADEAWANAASIVERELAAV